MLERKAIEKGYSSMKIETSAETICLAREEVKKQWIEQGIWNDKWKNPRAKWRWKHEEPLELESESETDPEFDYHDLLAPNFEFGKRKRPKSAEQLREIVERRRIRERDRELSRPYYQFIYQVSKERERLQAESRPETPNARDSPDINTKAYETVKELWIERSIWDRKWGILPGMNWRHEQPIDEFLAEEMGPDPTPPAESNGREVREAVPTVQDLFPETNLNHGPESGLLNKSLELPAAVDLVESPNGDPDHASSAPNVACVTGGGQGPVSDAGEGPQQARRASSQGGRTGSVSGTVLGSVHLAKVSKTPSRRKGPGRRRGRSLLELPCDVPPRPEPDLPGTATSTSGPRRSRRKPSEASTGPATTSSRPRRRSGRLQEKTPQTSKRPAAAVSSELSATKSSTAKPMSGQLSRVSRRQGQTKSKTKRRSR